MRVHQTGSVDVTVKGEVGHYGAGVDHAHGEGGGSGSEDARNGGQGGDWDARGYELGDEYETDRLVPFEGERGRGGDGEWQGEASFDKSDVIYGGVGHDEDGYGGVVLVRGGVAAEQSERVAEWEVKTARWEEEEEEEVERGFVPGMREGEASLETKETKESQQVVASSVGILSDGGTSNRFAVGAGGAVSTPTYTPPQRCVASPPREPGSGGRPPLVPRTAVKDALLLVLDVQTPDGHSDKIHVREGDDPAQLARNWCHRQDLPLAVPHMTTYIRSQLEAVSGGGGGVY